MKCRTILFTIVLSAIFLWSTFSLHADQQPNDEFRNTEHIGSVIWSGSSSSLSLPILVLNEQSQLELVFDLMDSEAEYLSYRIRHCSSNWEDSEIDQFDYANGYTEGSIDNFSFSRLTTVDFVSYRLRFPNQQMSPNVSGNYVIEVYYDDNPDDILLRRRFMVLEENIKIDSPGLFPQINRYKWLNRQLSIQLKYAENKFLNAFQDLKVVVLPEGRWDISKELTIPDYHTIGEMHYRLSDQSYFKKLREFRHFDSRFLSSDSQKTRAYRKEEDHHHLYLEIDTRQSQKSIKASPDLMGKYVVGRSFFSFQRGDADYVWTHFSYDCGEPITDGNIYIYGAISDWKVQPQFQMHYNYELGFYHLALPLKQGVYNYQYALQKDGQQELDLNSLEAELWNEFTGYLVLVYYRSFNARYDQLIGAKLLHN